MNAMPIPAGGRPVALVARLIQWWAMLGGLLLLVIVLMTSYSAVAGFLFASPFPGDFELTEMGIAIAAFCFLPWCQLANANVSADIFTSGASHATVRRLNRLGSLIALGFSILLLWRMYEGMKDYQTYVELTAILQIPIWYAFVPVLFSLVLLIIAALITLIHPQDPAAYPHRMETE